MKEFTWIYPTNYPVRSYQLQLVKRCLVHNTLVCLPTGLGKTFIGMPFVWFLLGGRGLVFGWQ